jgi:hypothetical protein
MRMAREKVERIKKLNGLVARLKHNKNDRNNEIE